MCRQVVRTSGGNNVYVESDGRLLKARSEDELLSSSHNGHFRSRSSSSLENALLTPRADRRIGKLRWNSELDLSILYGEYGDAYGEVLSDIRKGDNYSSLRKVSNGSCDVHWYRRNSLCVFCGSPIQVEVEIGPRRKSIATTYTGMAAAIADAMKTRRRRLTDSLGRESNYKEILVQLSMHGQTACF